MEKEILTKNGANFFGFESIDQEGKHHYHQKVIRGSGVLKLTEDEIIFSQWITKNEYRIPIDSIVKIDTKWSHNMKLSLPGKVFRIHYKDGNETKIFGVGLGGKFSLTKGWQGGNESWLDALQSLIT